MKKILFSAFMVLGIFTRAQEIDTAFSIGSSGNDDAGNLFVDEWGNRYTIGTGNDIIDFDPGTGLHMLNLYGGKGFVKKTDSSGNLLWVKTFGGGLTGGGLNFAIKDHSGNLVIWGAYGSGADFDPGPATYTLPVGGGPYILKLSPEGDFIWALSTGSYGISEIVADENNNLFLTSNYSGTKDFDPGAGVYNMTSAGGSDFYVEKLDSLGNFVWAKSFGSTGADYSRSVVRDAAGNLYVGGDFRNTVDFDPGSGVYNLTSAGGDDGYLLKLSGNGELIWVKQMGGTSGDNVYKLMANSHGSIYISGQNTGTVDYDFGPGTWIETASGENYIIRADTAGNFYWAKLIPANIGVMRSDNAGNIYIGGDFASSGDFDPGAGIYTLTAAGSTDPFLMRMDAAGNFVWAKSFTGYAFSSYDYIKSIFVDEEYRIFATGMFQDSMDIITGPGDTTRLMGLGMKEIFEIHLTQGDCDGFTIAIDSVADLSCSGNALASVVAYNGTSPYFYSWNTIPVINDSIAAIGTRGIYEVTVTDSHACIRKRKLLINGPYTTTGFDLNVNLVAGIYRPGIPSYTWLDGFNDGCDPVTGLLSIVLDPLVTYNSSVPAPDIISGDTLKWNFTSLTYDSAHLTPQVNVTTSTSATLGDSICFDVLVTPVAGDAISANNIKHYCFPVLTSYDPNDKQVYPQGECEEHVILPGKKMTYTVRFQNTGNAEAINIYILDSLDADLDLNTVRVVGNSHSLITEVLPGNVLKFRFDNIYLPDSTSDEPNSHGYVIFEVDQLTGLPSGTILENTAYIYFDFNPAVVTNTVHNMIGPVSLPCDIVTGVTEQVLGENIKVYPNPVTNSVTISTETTSENISLLDLSGRTVMQAKPKGTLTNLDLSQLQNGIYFVKLVTVQGEHVVKVVKQ